MKKRKNYIVTIIISVAVIAIALIKLGFFTESKINPIYSYTIQKNDDYEVLLKPNKFYSSEKLLPGGYYASNSINAYSIKFKCDFIGDQKTNIKYNYSIFGNLVGNVRNNENKDMEIWSRNFILCDNIYNEQKSVDKISIDEQVNIDYEYYNNLARLYEKEYGIMIDAILKVRFNIAYVTEFNSLDEKIEDFIELDIPITTTVSEVKENYQKVTTNSIIPQIENRKVHKNIFGVVGILFMVGDIVIIVILAIKSKKTPEEIYRLVKLRKINCYC